MSHLRIIPSYMKLNNNAFTLRVSYDHVESTYMHRYSIECIDTKNWTKIIIDSNVVDEICRISLEDALARTKFYLKDRFGYEIFEVVVVPQEVQRYDRNTKTYKTIK